PLSGRPPGPGAARSAPGDPRGIGAHPYPMPLDSDTGRVMVDDPLRGDPFVFDPDDAPPAKATWGGFFGADGEHLRPATAVRTPDADPPRVAPETDIGETGREGDAEPPAPATTDHPTTDHPTTDQPITDQPITDHPITDAEVDLAAAAVRELGADADPAVLLHDDRRGPAADTAAR